MTDEAYCANCGREQPEAARFCASCGSPRAGAAAPTVIDDPHSAETDAAATPALDLPHSPTPQSPAPGGPQSPAAGAPQSPAPGGPESPASGAPPPPPAGGAPPASQRRESPRPSAGPTPPPQLGDAAELARRLGAQARRPAVAAALGGGALAALVTLAAGLIIAVAFPDGDSLIGALGVDASLATETLRQSVSFLQVPFDRLPFPDVPSDVDLHGRVAPLLLLAVPVGACALAAALVLPRTRGSAIATRLASCAGIALAFATLMLVAALAAGDADPGAAGTFFAALLWASIGALAGAGLSLRREGAAMRLPGAPASVPEPVGALGRAAVASLRPLGVLLLVTGVLGTAAWVTYALTDDDGDEDRARTTVEIALFAADHAVHFAELGAFVPFEPAREELEEAALPAPTADPDEVTGDESYRIFAFRDALPAYLFVPGVIVLIALPLMLALYGGFAAAGAAGGARSPGRSAALGAVVGPVWAITMAVLDALATKSLEFSGPGGNEELTLFGSADGGGAFLFFLLVGGALGALGGLLAGSTGPAERPAGVGVSD